MPIRTDRGRGAALRQFWSWPLKSGRHMVVTALAAAAVITGVAVAANAVQDPKQQPDPQAGSAAAVTETSTPRPAPNSTSSTAGSTSSNTESSSPSTTSGDADSSEPPEPGKVAAGDAGARTTAYAFMTRWVRPGDGTTKQEWVQRLVPYTMPGVVQNLETIALERIPATKVTGKATVVSNKDGVAEVDVPTDAGTIRVTVVAYPDGRWLVRSWAPVKP